MLGTVSPFLVQVFRCALCTVVTNLQKCVKFENAYTQHNLKSKYRLSPERIMSDWEVDNSFGKHG